MATESFDKVLHIESAEDAAKLMSIIDSSKKADPLTFDYHDEEDVKAIKEIFD